MSDRKRVPISPAQYFNTSRLQTSHFRLQTHRQTLQLIPFARSSKRWVIAGLSLPFTATPSANDLRLLYLYTDLMPSSIAYLT